jgi:hypothetical protein
MYIRIYVVVLRWGSTLIMYLCIYVYPHIRYVGEIFARSTVYISIYSLGVYTKNEAKRPENNGFRSGSGELASSVAKTGL